MLALVMLTACAPAMATQQAVLTAEQGQVELKKTKRMREAVARGSLHERVRSRGPQVKRPKHRNRLHISRRTRRRHRRAR